MNANAGDNCSSGGESSRGRLVRLGVNFLGFQSLWFACVVGAGYGLPGLGPAAAALWAGLHLSLLSRTAGSGGGGSGEGSSVGGVGGVGVEIRLLLAAALVGAALDSALVNAGLIAFPAAARFDIAPDFLSPAWMIALWVAFATTLRHSLDWMRGRYWPALFAGAIFGPLAYLAGERFGAIVLAPDKIGLIVLAPDFVGLLAVAIEWALAMPLLLWLRERFEEGSYPMRSLAEERR